MIRRAGKRLCKGEIFRTTLGLVNQAGGLDLGYLPTYAILRIVERALPDCIFSHAAGNYSGLLAEYEVVPIIEAVVNFARESRKQRLIEQPARIQRSRIEQSNDDDNDADDHLTDLGNARLLVRRHGITNALSATGGSHRQCFSNLHPPS